MPHFNVPLNLPHAATIAERIQVWLSRMAEHGAQHPGPVALGLAAELRMYLDTYMISDENPPEPEATEAKEHAAALGRKLVDAIEQAGCTHDRLGQCIRNLFECLEKGEEGARLSLRAGENPNSTQRPK